MKHFRAFLGIELKRFFRKRWLLVISILILLFSLLFTQVGIAEYKNILAQKEKFQQLENMKVKHYTTYTQYGTYGLRFLFVPQPQFVFFINSTPINGVTAYVDSGERLKIYHSLKGRNIFTLKKYSFTDFSGIVLVFGSLLALFYAIDISGGREYLKFLTSIKKSGSLYFLLHSARLAVLFLAILSIICCNLALLALNRVDLPLSIHFIAFLVLVFLLVLFFYLLGVVFSTVESKTTAVVYGLAAWFILVFVLPAAVQYTVSLGSKTITPLDELEMKKFKLVMEFEKRAIKNKITYKYGEKLTTKVSDIVLSYFKNEFKKINLLETKLRNNMRSWVTMMQRVSLFSPATFYLSSINEISSSGYTNMLTFHRVVQEKKTEFFKFYMDKIYFSENSSNFTRVESFIKGEDNIYRAPARLPHWFLPGVVLTLLYIVGLTILGFTRFRRYVFKNFVYEPGKQPQVNLPLDNGDFKVVVNDDDRFNQQLYNMLSGDKQSISKGFVNITVAEQDITKTGIPGDILYICQPDYFPGDMKVADFFIFLSALAGLTAAEGQGILESAEMRPMVDKTINRLNVSEKGTLTLAIMQGINRSIYLVNDTARGMPIEFAVRLNEQMQRLKENGAIVIYLVSPDFMRGKINTGVPQIYDSPHWCQLMDHYKELFDM